MARIRVRTAAGRYWVTVTGQLRGRDLRRLEHACGPALEQREAPLTLTLPGVRDIDEPVKAFLERLANRGAVLQYD